MAEAPAAGTGSDQTKGVPYYEKQRDRLRELIERRKKLDKELVSGGRFQNMLCIPLVPAMLTSVPGEQQATEDDIYKKESKYLENTPNGNIIAGFDTYQTRSTVRRRKKTLTEGNRQFSEGSISYKPIEIAMPVRLSRHEAPRLECQARTILMLTRNSCSVELGGQVGLLLLPA